MNTSLTIRWSAVLGLLFLPVAGRAAERDLSTFQVGINTHRVFPADLPSLEELGIGSPRIDLKWSEVSSPDGKVLPEHPTLTAILQAPAFIKNPLGVLGYGHPAFDHGGRIVSAEGRRAYVDYCLKTVGLLANRSNQFEIWNEWANKGMGVPESEGYGRPEDYLPLLKESYAAIKAKYPHTTILGGATAGTGEGADYLKRFFQMGGLNSLDGLVIHPYQHNKTGDERLPEVGLEQRLSKLFALMAGFPKGSSVPLYATEIGWPTFDAAAGTTSDQQAKYLVRSALLLAAEPRIRGMWLYELRDGNSNQAEQEHHFGMITHEGKPKPAFYALQDVISFLHEARSIETVKTSIPDVVTMKLHYADASVGWLCWAVRPDKKWEIEFKTAPSSGESIKQFGNRDPGALSAAVKRTGATLQLTVADMPVLLRGPAANDAISSIHPADPQSPGLP